VRRDRTKIHAVIERLLERPKFRPGRPARHNAVSYCGLECYTNMRLLAQNLTQEQSNSIQIRKNAQNHENRQIYNRPSLRTEDQPRRAHYRPPKATFCFGVRDLGVLPDSCQLFEGGTTGIHAKGGTTGFHHEAARNFAGRDLHTSARGFGQSESGSHEPDHQSTQSKPVPTQCRRRANFRAALPVRTSNRHNEACEISCWHKS
jgi:hypothetical protein